MKINLFYHMQCNFLLFLLACDDVLMIADRISNLNEHNKVTDTIVSTKIPVDKQMADIVERSSTRNNFVDKDHGIRLHAQNENDSKQQHSYSDAYFYASLLFSKAESNLASHVQDPTHSKVKSNGTHRLWNSIAAGVASVAGMASDIRSTGLQIGDKEQSDEDLTISSTKSDDTVKTNDKNKLSKDGVQLMTSPNGTTNNDKVDQTSVDIYTILRQSPMNVIMIGSEVATMITEAIERSCKNHLNKC